MNTRLDRLSTLVKTLIESTREGAISWLPTDLPGSYLFSGTEIGVVVRRVVSDRSEAHELVLLDDNGREVGGYPASRAVLPEASVIDGREIELRTDLARLYAAVTEEHAATREAVASLLRDLQGASTGSG